MMNKCYLFTVFLMGVAFTLFPLSGTADKVSLINGGVLEGRILSESKFEVEIETSRNPEGTIRTIKVVQREAVESMTRGNVTVAVMEDGASRVTEAPVEGEDPNELDLGEVRSWMEGTTGILADGKYDEAIGRFKRVAKHPKLIEQSRGDPAVAQPALSLRASAYRLWMTAIKGKGEFLEARAKETEDASENRLDLAEDRLKDYQKSKRADSSPRETIEMRSRQRLGDSVGENNYQRDVNHAQKNMLKFQEWNEKNTLAVQNLDAEYDLLREQLKQLQDELKKLGKR